MSTALVLSLLIHALLLSLTFGSQEFGLPGLGLPWRERRFEAGDLRVALVPAPVTAATPALIEPSEHLMSTGMAKPDPIAVPGVMPVMTPSHAGGPENVAFPSIPSPVLIASERSDTAALVVPVTPLVPTPVMAAAPSATSPAVVIPTPRDASDTAQKQIDPEVRERTLELAKLNRAKQEAQQPADQMQAVRELATLQQAERLEALRQAAVRQEAERVEATRVEAERQAVARQEIERVEAARVEAERQEAARQAVAREAAQVEVERLAAARQEAVRQEAERGEATRVEAERQEVARQAVAREDAQVEVERLEAARQAAVRQEAERVEATRVEVERQEVARQEMVRQEREQQEAARAQQEARREAVLRAIGRQLDEEAAKRDAASLAARLSSTLLTSSSSARRGRLFGRTDPNTELILYAEAWSRKIELNMTFDMVREAAKQRHTNPLVTVALRSDGSVESVTFVVSSGVTEIDEAIRRIVQSQAPYPSFPPGLAREYDVIEIRRSWYFDMAVRLF